VKSEPDSFSIEDLARAPKQTTFWDGVRNYQARNFMRAMKVGDRVLFYHSSVEPAAIVGTAIVVREAYPDFTALNRDHDHYDPKATREAPIWDMVDIKLEQVFDRPLTLPELRGIKELAKMELLRRGSRLSVQPVTESEWDTVLAMANRAHGPKAEHAQRPAKNARQGLTTRRSSKTKRAAGSSRKRTRS
jgi:predicted RNA-binding protein with PUA-like domain